MDIDAIIYANYIDEINKDNKKYQIIPHYNEINNTQINRLSDILFDIMNRYFINNPELQQYIVPVENTPRVYDLSRVLQNYNNLNNFPDRFILSLQNFVLNKENYVECDRIRCEHSYIFHNMDEFYKCHQPLFNCIERKQFQIPFDIYVYRGIPISICKYKKGDIINHSRWLWCSLYKHDALHYTKDTSEYYEKAFNNNSLSFGNNHSKKPRIGSLLKILIRAGTPYFDNSYHSGFGMESELIFSKNSDLKILDIDEIENILTLELLPMNDSKHYI
jgi:hypothetical protein